MSSCWSCRVIASHTMQYWIQFRSNDLIESILNQCIRRILRHIVCRPLSWSVGLSCLLPVKWWQKFLLIATCSVWWCCKLQLHCLLPEIPYMAHCQYLENFVRKSVGWAGLRSGSSFDDCREHDSVHFWVEWEVIFSLGSASWSFRKPWHACALCNALIYHCV